MIQKKPKMAWILSMVLVLAIAGESIYFPGISKAAGYGIGNPVVSNGAVIWDCVYFGNYYQSGMTAKEPIKWRVLSVSGNDAFLLADQNLDCRQFNISPAGSPEPENPEPTAAPGETPGPTPEPTPVLTWENSTLRSWLNGYDSDSNRSGMDFRGDNFLNTAFNQAEQSAIRPSKVINAANPYRTETKAGNDTMDQVFLLSLAEASNSSYGFLTDFQLGSEARVAKNTAYVETLNSSMYGAGMADSWWLRTPGYNMECAAYVGLGGYGYIDGYAVDYRYCAVRPALHLDLSSSQWKKAGKISSGLASQYGDNSSNSSTITRNSTAVTSTNVSKPGKVTGVSIAVKKKTMTISWKSKSNITGYQLQYALNKKFTKKKKSINIKNYVKKRKVKNIKKKKTYYVRIRAYRTASGKKIYGKWSKVKKVKIK
ncbi:MAG: fibronectin type III domain-containing protein [Lachnospiraceae bacterium]|nr:fibronectin type III domain-containing protein [Lachnospiraceae bacterium]